MRGDAIVLRPGGPDDLDALLRLEQAAFSGDQLDRRAFRHALRSPTMTLCVAESGKALLGYVLVERRRNSSIARLTSVAVAPDASGRGLGRQLVGAAEQTSRGLGGKLIRLEVRSDNGRARTLYEGLGYRLFATVDDYYEDGAAALRFEKTLA